MSTQRASIGKEVRSILGESAPIEFQDAITTDLMARGESRGKTNARVIVEAVVEMARNKERWAIEWLADRAEGKAAQTVAQDDAGRHTEEALNDVTTRHLNELAGVATSLGVGAFTGEPDQQRDGDETAARDRGAPPARPILDLPEDGDSDPEDAE